MAEWEAVAHTLVTERFNALVGYARVVAGSDANAEDLVQEALVATFARPRDLTNVAVAEVYVRRAIVTRFIDGTRRRTPRTSSRDVADVPDLPGGTGHAEAVERSVDLHAALAQLSPRERVCVALRHLEGLSVRETAHVLGLAEGSVKRYVSDGIVKLNGLLGTDESPEDGAYMRVVGRGAE